MYNGTSSTYLKPVQSKRFVIINGIVSLVNIVFAKQCVS